MQFLPLDLAGVGDRGVRRDRVAGHHGPVRRGPGGRPAACARPGRSQPAGCAGPSSRTTTPPGTSTRCSRWPSSTPATTADPPTRPPRARGRTASPAAPVRAAWSPARAWLDGGMADYDAFLLVSFGGPEGPDDVMPFLQNVTRGRGIPPERLEAVAEHYYAVGGVSPINQQCRDLIAAIGKDFAAAGVDLPIYWGNRNWDPYLTATWPRWPPPGCGGRWPSSPRPTGPTPAAASTWTTSSGRGPRPGPGPRRSTRSGTSTTTRASSSRSPTPPWRPSGRCPPASARTSALVFTAHSVPDAMAAASGPPPGGRYPSELAEASAAHRRTGQRRHRRRAPLAAGLPEPQRAPVAALARPGCLRLPGGPGPGRSSAARSWPRSASSATTWRSCTTWTSRRRRPPGARAAAGPRRDPQYGPALHLNDHRAGHRTAGGPGQPGRAGLPGLRLRRLLPGLPPRQAVPAARWPHHERCG